VKKRILIYLFVLTIGIWFTQAVGESLIIRFAAAANALLDGVIHNDTTDSTPVRGDLITGNATPAWTRTAIGGASTVLTTDGTDPAWATVTSAMITNNTIANADMADNSIDSDDYVDGSIDAIHLAADVIDETKIADDGVDSEHYNADSIDNEHINWADIDYLGDEGAAVDEAYAAGWNADVGPPEKDDVYDYLHNFDADDDGSFTDEAWYTNVLDGTTAFTDFNGAVIDSDNYVADSIDDTHINWGMGATVVGADDITMTDEFDFSANTNIQDVMDDIDAAIVALDTGADGDVDNFDATALAAAIVELDPNVDTADEIEAILTDDDMDFGTGACAAAEFNLADDEKIEWGGDEYITYDSTRNDIVVSDDFIIEDWHPSIYLRSTADNTAYGFHYHTDSTYNFALFYGTDDGSGFSVGNSGFPLMYSNDGATLTFPIGIGTHNDEDFIRVNDGIAKIIPTIEIWHGSLVLASAWDEDAEWPLMWLHADRYPSGIVITKWYVQCNAADPVTELTGDLKYCDDNGAGAFPGGNAVLIDALDTTTGNSSETNMAASDLGSGIIPAGKKVYISLDADPADADVYYELTILGYIPE